MATSKKRGIFLDDRMRKYKRWQYAHYSKALQRRVIRVSETFEESRSSGDARPEQGEWSVCP